MPALAKDPKRRYDSAGQFGAKLRALRYSLEATVGDPATELAKIIESAEEHERASVPKVPSRRSFDLEPSEMTAFRIRTADAFSQRDIDGSSIVQARAIIDRFEEEETRLAQLSGDQMRILRDARPIQDSQQFRESGELTAAAQPRPQRLTDEQTVARAPINPDDFPTYPPDGRPSEPQSNEDFTTYPPVNQRFDADEATRLVAPRDRRTPTPERNTHRPPPGSPGVVTEPPPTPPPIARSGLPDRAALPEAVRSTTRPRGPTPGPPMSREAMSASSRAQNPLPGLPPEAHQGPTLLGPPPIPLGPPPSVEDTPMPGTVHGRSQSQSESSLRPRAPVLPAPSMARPEAASVSRPEPVPMVRIEPPMAMSAPLMPMPAPPVAAPMGKPMPQADVWGAPARVPSAPLIDERASKPSRSAKSSSDKPPRAASRSSVPNLGSRRVRKQAIQPWMLVVGAIVMAGLAFAVTRACIHPTANRPAAAAETKPASP
jgi:hypothetical protein